MTATPLYDATFPNAEWHLLSQTYCRDGIRMYLEFGVPCGDFVTAVLCGDWNRAIAKADHINAGILPQYRYFLENYAPAGSYGSPENYQKWISHRGLSGLQADEKPKATTDKPKIFVFENSGAGTDWIGGVALAESGHHLGSHISSHHNWFLHDMGLTSDWKHDEYKKHYPDGYELVHVKDPRNHEGLKAAYALNQKLAKEAEKLETTDG